MIARDAFLEWADVFGNYYGTGKEETQARLDSGEDLVLVIDVQGARQVRERVPEIEYVDLRFDERLYVRPAGGREGGRRGPRVLARPQF